MKGKIKMTHREKRENVAGFLFCLPCILGFLFFAAIPMIISFIMSFSNYSIVKESHFVGLDNFIALFKNQDFLWSFRNLIIFTVVFLLGTLILGFLWAWLLERPLKGDGIFRSVYMFPMAVSFIASGVVWAVAA